MRYFTALLSFAIICGVHRSVAQSGTPGYLASVPLAVTVNGDQLSLYATVQDTLETLDYLIFQRERVNGTEWDSITTWINWPYTFTLDTNDQKIYEFKVVRRDIMAQQKDGL